MFDGYWGMNTLEDFEACRVLEVLFHKVFNHGLCFVFHAQLFVGAVGMPAHGVLADVEVFGCLPVGVTMAQVGQHFALAGAKGVGVLVGRLFIF